MALDNGRTGLLTQFLEGAVPQVSEENARAFIGVTRKLPLHLRIYASGYDEDIGISIIVKVDDSRAPACITRLNVNPARQRGI